MLLLIVIPVLAAVAVTQRYLTTYAPLNALIRHVRTSPPSWKIAAGLAALAAGLLLAMRGVHLSIGAGGPGWLHLLALLLAWDAIKVGALALVMGCRWTVSNAQRRASEACR